MRPLTTLLVWFLCGGRLLLGQQALDPSNKYVDPASGSRVGQNISAAIKELGPAGGVVYVPAGTYDSVTIGFSITQPNVSVVSTAGSAATIINYVGTGDFIRVQMGLKPGQANITQAGRINGFTINGTASGRSGIHIGDTVGMHLDDIVINRFNGAPTKQQPDLGSGVWFDNVNAFTERTLLTRVHSNYNTKDFRFTNTGGTDFSSSFGYSRFLDIRCNTGPDQICISFESGFMYHSTIIATANLTASSATVIATATEGCVTYSGGPACAMQQNLYDINAECTGCKDGTLLNIAPNTVFEGTGIIDGYFLKNVVNGTVEMSASHISGFPFIYSASASLVAGRTYNPVTVLQADTGIAGRYRFGLGNNVFWNGSAWQLNGDGVHNGGSAIFSGAGDGEMKFYVVPSSGGRNQVLRPESLPGFQTLSLTSSDMVVMKGIAANGMGLKHKRFPPSLGGNCPSPARVGATCTSASLVWDSPFVDNNYTVSCTLDHSVGQPHISNVEKLPSGAGITATIVASTADAADGGLECIAIHD
jgi:hypothetical protein